METYFTVIAVLGSVFILFAFFKAIGSGKEPKDIRDARRRYERKVMKYKLQGRDYEEERRQREADAVKKKVDKVFDDLHREYPHLAELEDGPASSSVEA